MKKNKKKKNVVLRVLIIIASVILIAFIVASCFSMYYIKHYKHEFYRVETNYVEINTQGSWTHNDAYHIRINRRNNKIKIVSKRICDGGLPECKTSYERISGVLTDDEVNYILEELSKKPSYRDLEDIADTIYLMIL